MNYQVVSCPYDQQLLQTFVNNQIISQQIDSLLVYCKYSLDGNQHDQSTCPAKIPLNKKKYSIDISSRLIYFDILREHEDECIYRIVPCPNGCLQTNLRQKVS